MEFIFLIFSNSSFRFRLRHLQESKRLEIEFISTILGDYSSKPIFFLPDGFDNGFSPFIYVTLFHPTSRMQNQ